MSSGDGALLPLSHSPVRNKKQAYFAKLNTLLEEYSTIFIVNVDNVGSNQMHQIRHALRGQAVVLMGKNTMVRKVLRALAVENPAYERLMATIYGNIGFVFTKGDLKEIRKLIVNNRVAAPAKAGAIAPVDVVIPAGNTGMGPEKTSFFQALGVATKIARGTIEIISDVELIKSGTKVGASEAALLNMLNISPFTYGMNIMSVYDKGNVFAPEVLDVEDETLIENLLTGIKNIASISLAANYPTVASVPHSMVNGYKRILGLGLALEEYSFEAVTKVCILC
jgi:large subunit ribosomal protein LP0